MIYIFSLSSPLSYFLFVFGIRIEIQFVTADNTDTGVLKEIRRYYKQNGNTVQQPKVSVNGNTYDSITDDFCKDQATEFAIPDNEGNVYSYDFNEFGRKGGMQSLSDSMDRGLVLVMSLWDDHYAHM